jgi:hypothetical protein
MILPTLVCSPTKFFSHGLYFFVAIPRGPCIGSRFFYTQDGQSLVVITIPLAQIEFGQLPGSYFHPHFQDVVFFFLTVTVLTSTSSLAALFDQAMTTKLLNLTFQAGVFIFNTHDQPTLEIHLLLQIIVQPE